jgi:hypothetical protein
MGKNNILDLVSAKAKEDKIKLTEYDITMNIIKQENMFKGTIIICIIYAIVGLLLVILSYFFDKIREFLFDTFLAFTIVYIIGTILIVSIMLYYIFTFKPVKISNDINIDEISCPDYWTATIIDDKYIGTNFDSNYAREFNYKCEMNTDIFDKKELYKKNSLYRLTNNYINTTSNLPNLNGIYNSTKLNFDTDYNANSNNYKLYVDLNSQPITNTDLASNLGIFNDKKRLEDVMSNLNKIALIENNYGIDSDGNATDLIFSTNILNPHVNFTVWDKDNTAKDNNYLANGGSGSNGINIFDWGDYDYDYLSNLLSDKNVKSIKITAPSTTSTTNIYMGRLEFDNEIPKKIQFIKNNTSNWSNAAFSISPVAIKDTNNIISTTILYKWFKDDTASKTANVDTSTLTITEGSQIINNHNIFKPIKLQIYDKTKFRPQNIPKNNIYKDPSTAVVDAGTNYISPLLCDTVYPKLLSRFEKDNSNNSNNNDLRCAYSKICGIPWSDLKCN